MMSEYFILLLFAHLLYQSDAVYYIDARSYSGWSLVSIISARIMFNSICTFYSDLKNVFTRIRSKMLRRENLRKYK